MTAPPAPPPATTCSASARAVDEDALGTAPVATTWLALEQPGPWGRTALTASHLDPRLGRALDEAAAGTGVRLALVRRPGPHPDDHARRPRRVLAAHVRPGATWLVRWEVDDPASLLGLDVAALGRGRRPEVPGATDDGRPALLVCTNGRRDVCCALRGRPVARALAGLPGLDVWEATHLGGHRFAATAVALPTGAVLAGLDDDGGAAGASAAEAVARGEVPVRGYRGRSCFGRAEQAAEGWVRQRLVAAGEAVGPDDLDAAPEGAGRSAVVHRDGRRWHVTTTRHETTSTRPESCGGLALPVERWVVERVVERVVAR